jgi:hypothetical protein
MKCVLIVDEALPVGLLVNTASVLSLTLGQKVDGLIGPDLKDGSSDVHVGITTVPIPILKASAEMVREIRDRATKVDGLLVVDVTDAAQTTTSYDAYATRLSAATPDQLKYLGVALCGDKRAVNKLTGSLPLLR